MILPANDDITACAFVAIGWPALADMSEPVTFDKNAKTPAPLEILPH